MALLFADGFDSYTNSTDLGKKWNDVSGAALGTSAGRRGGGAVRTTSALIKHFAAGSDTIIVGTAVIPVISDAGFTLQGDAGATSHLTLRILANGAIEVRRGTSAGTILGTSATGAVAINSTAYIEAKVKLHDTTGTVEVRVNGSSTPALNLTGVDTKNGGTGTVFDAFSFRAAGGAIYYDDLYICDTTGSTNNDFLGDVRIDTIRPTSDGNYQQFTPSTAGTHYTLVDESYPNTTDHVESSTVGHRETYGLSDLPALTSSTVYAVVVNAAVLKDDSGARSIGTTIRTGGVDADGASVTLGTAQMFVSQIYQTDASGAAWTQTSVNAMEAGVRVTA